MNSRLKKASSTAIVGLGLFAGAAGLTAAASGGSTPAPNLPAESANQVNDNETDEDGGINCENGIDTATGNECDGGPAAARADEATEAPDNEADEASATRRPISFRSSVASSNGLVAPEVADANEAETDDVGDEADDGIDHQFEGEEVGENGNGIPDADDVNETEADD